MRITCSLSLKYLSSMGFSLGTPVSPLLKNWRVELQFVLDRTDTR